MEYKTSLNNGQIKINILVETGKHKPTIKMFDSRYLHTEHGQFISEYFVETLQASNDIGGGLNLDLSVSSDWFLSPQNIVDLKKWLNMVSPTKTITV